MATNLDSNQNFYRRGPSTGGLPPASDLLSPQLSNYSSTKNRLYSVASPSTAPASPYNAYQSPSTPAFAVDAVPSPSYESISSPANSTKPSTPLAVDSPVSNGVYYPPTQHYYPQSYPRLPSVDSLPCYSGYGRPAEQPSHLLMPPPKVALAPSVMAAAKASQQPQSPTTSTTTKRQRPSTSQRAQQQRARQLKQQEAERLRCQEERAYLTKFMHLRKTVRALVFKNGALADEVARLKMQIDICKEETKMVAKRVQHHERNQIRRAQTHQRKALARAQAAANTTNPLVPSQSSPAD
ncbi:hypothetical protein M3Y94_00929300 [Aphelenchoides besseyi]|nr:hypothetical protein M3Y94_00929300 [Aphelenchoides besseyi]KAI6225009.1 Transforming growth factor beta regulator 1 [Aphelenchoides besseyi]